eukprot:TRINITY_DN5315_c0_g1_i1.p1 TRINITY_DN5315_c0_g1~~TRINITY_DN5315_c0_g1_i1.p1  ORF type:complete len:724 (-),score=227.43 TRINITY_DN5315_c0_g1_i1:115-2286(-)
MGTGKTIICIAVILSSKGKVAVPFFLHHVICPPHPEELRHNAPDDMDHEGDAVMHPDPKPSSPVRSLLELASRAIHNHGVPYAGLVPAEVEAYIEALPPTYVDTVRERWSPRRSKSSPDLSLRVYLSSATLVVVPHTIIDQWAGELQLHNTLNVLVVRNKDPLPPALQLLQYDVVVITHSRLSSEPGLDSLSTFVDHPKPATKVSPLLQVYWQRMIVDEGHVLGRSNTNLSTLAGVLYCEKRWICSGTPLPSTVVDAEMSSLHGMLSFLKLAPYCEKKIWNKLVEKPFKSYAPAGLARLQALLQRIMVRTSSQVLTQELTLPPCYHTIIPLQFSQTEALKYNEVVAQVQANLITSQFEGPDSLYSPVNRRYAMEAIHKLREACFSTPLLSDNRRALLRETTEKELRRTCPPLDPDHKDMLLQIIRLLDQTEAYANHLALESEPTTPPPSSSSSSSSSSSPFATPDIPHHDRVVSGKLAPTKLTYDDPTASSSSTSSSSSSSSSSASSPSPLVSPDPSSGHYRPKFGVSGSRPVSYDPSASTKLLYLMKRLHEETPNHKCIIFTQFNEHLATILEALDKSGLSFVEYHTAMTTNERSSALITFDTTPSVRVIVMNTELAAYGINLTSATYMFMMDPVWDLAKERQALKRAHRIGQTRPVYVEKLVVQDSLEEMMVRINSTSESGEESVAGGAGDISRQDHDAAQQRKVHSILRTLRLVPFACQD